MRVRVRVRENLPRDWRLRASMLLRVSARVRVTARIEGTP